MSGGAYDYKYHVIDDLAAMITIEPSSSHASSLRKEFVDHLKLVAQACKAIEWNDSDDGDPEEDALIRRVLGK